MIKRDLKNGMLVTTAIGKVYFVWNGRLLRKDGYLSLADYEQDFQFRNREYPQYDITIIYSEESSIGAPGDIYELLETFGRTVLWNKFDTSTRREKRPMTLFELEQELGYPVEIVEG